MKSSLALCAVTALLLVSSGCSMLTRKVLTATPYVVPQTNVVTSPEVTKQLVQTVTVTNNVSLTNTVEILHTNLITRTEITQQTNLVYAPSPLIVGTVQTAQTVGEMLPPPYGTLVGIAGGLLGSAATWFAARKNKDANTAKTQLSAVIRGVQEAVSTGQPVKPIIADKAASAGVGDSLKTLVKSLT